VLAGVVAACSSGGNRRDQNFGTDVGTVYTPPEMVDSAATTDGGTTDATDATAPVGDASAETTVGADGDDGPAGDAG